MINLEQNQAKIEEIVREIFDQLEYGYDLTVKIDEFNCIKYDNNIGASHVNLNVSMNLHNAGEEHDRTEYQPITFEDDFDKLSNTYSKIKLSSGHLEKQTSYLHSLSSNYCLIYCFCIHFWIQNFTTLISWQ